jgi:hypothetical protein
LTPTRQIWYSRARVKPKRRRVDHVGESVVLLIAQITDEGGSAATVTTTIDVNSHCESAYPAAGLRAPAAG